jgi:hypothetical protein
MYSMASCVGVSTAGAQRSVLEDSPLPRLLELRGSMQAQSDHVAPMHRDIHNPCKQDTLHDRIMACCCPQPSHPTTSRPHDAATLNPGCHTSCRPDAKPEWPSSLNPEPAAVPQPSICRTLHTKAQPRTCCRPDATQGVAIVRP